MHSPVSRQLPDSLSHIVGGGEMGARIRAFDWAGTPLGAAEAWPRSLKTVVRIMLDSRYAMWMLWGPDFTFFCNDAYADQTLGLKRTWAIGASARRVWAEIWPDIGPRIDRVLAGGAATWDEGLMLFLERSGVREETYHTFSYSPLPDDDGRIAGMLCVVTEETERIIGERRVKLLRDLAAEFAVARTERDVCAALERRLHADARDLPFAVLFLGADPGTAQCAARINVAAGSPLCDPRTWPIGEALAAGAPRVVDDLARHAEAVPAGPWPWPPARALVLPIADAARQGAYAGALIAGLNPSRPLDEPYEGFLDLLTGQIAGAIGSAHAYESERRRAEALAELDRAKTAFFSNVSHEFRTPLTLMLAPVEDLVAHGELGAPVRQRLEVVYRNALRLQKLVNSLLEFSRLEAGRTRATYEPTDLAALTRDLASNFRAAVERAGLTLVVDCPPLARPVHVDREMWEKIVLNLLSNAFKFTLDGRIVVRLAESEGQAILDVEDTGVGIAAHEIPRLFERFHRVEGSQGRTHEGSGIGLALVQELVRLHGGTIEVESELRRGSRFRVRIPLGSAHLPAEQIRTGSSGERAPASGAHAYVQEALRWLPEPADGAAMPLEAGAALAHDRRFEATHGARVIVADDNADMRGYVASLLGATYRVEAVADGVQALEAARREPPGLIVSDVMMPRMDGLQLLAAVREDERLRTTPVILLSARAGEEARIEGLDRGADDYLVKPFSARELLARAGALLERTQMRAQAEQRLRMGLGAARMIAWDVELPDGAVTLSGNGRDILGTDVRDVGFALGLVDARDRAGHSRKVHEAMSLGGSLDDKIRYTRPDTGEQRWLWVRGETEQNSRGEPVRLYGVTLDITEIKRAEEALQDADRRKDEFLAMLAHELRNPLAPIANASEVLSRTPLPAAAREAVAIVHRQVRILARLVDDLLDVSRITRGRVELQKQSVLVSDVVAQAVEIVQPLIDERRHRLSVTQQDGVRVLGDRARLVQCVANLLHNAAKYTDPGGVILLDSHAEDGEAVVRVVDNGIGIPSELQSSIFELFVQGDRALDRAQGGLGIGLSVVKRLVEMHGGRASVLSHGPGTGATFEIRLPRLEAHEPAEPAAPLPRVAPRRILVVDDNVDAAQSMLALLRLEGHEVAFAYSAEEALEHFESVPPQIALLDIGLPRMNGYELAQRIRANPALAHVHLVAVTGYGQPEDITLARAAGFDAHVTKPASLGALQRIIAQTRG